MANARTKTEQKTQDDEKVTQATQRAQGNEKAAQTPQEPAGDAKPQPEPETKKSSDEKPEAPKFVSFQDLDEPDENLPGVVPPKKEN